MWARWWPVITVHPHACGEYAVSAIPRSINQVHPHACGEYCTRGVLGGVGGRFIPTRVGNTNTCRIRQFHCTGSSPRVWGIRFVGLLSNS